MSKTDITNWANDDLRAAYMLGLEDGIDRQRNAASILERVRKYNNHNQANSQNGNICNSDPSMSNVGTFGIYVSEPYPCWISLRYEEIEIRFHHRELSDLKYAVDKAMQQARLKLKTDAGEI